jgi:sensor histidine kinase YesM
MGYFIISESRKIKTRAFETVTRDTQTTSAFMDEEIKGVNTVMQNVAYSNLIKDHFLTYLNKPTSDTDDYSDMQNIKVLTDLLTAIIGPSRPVDQIYLYALEKGCIGVGLDNSNSDDVSVKDKDWYENLEKSENNNLIFCDRDPRLKKYFTYEEGANFLTVCSVYQSTFYKPQGVIEVKHSISSLTNRLKKIDTGAYNEKIYIYDQTGKCIYSPDDDTMSSRYFAVLDPEDHRYEDATCHVAYETGTHLFVNTSSYSGFTTVIAIDNHDLYAPIFDFVKVNLLIFLIFIVIILFLSYVVSRVITIPVMKMYANITALHTDEENIMSDSLDEVNTNIIELDTLYSAVVKMHERTKTSMKREISLNNQRLQSQILALQSQMNPHFLYNSLATISAMADEGMNEEVINMCQTISRILRYISSDKDPLVSIKEDVAHARDYLECMKMRYGYDLIYEIDIPEEMMELKIPKLCLQLIVENSIKFATKSVRAPWKININGVLTGIYWEISVKDNGKGFTAEDIANLNEKIAYINETDFLPDLEINGMGLMNIYIRFKTLYHGKHIFRISNNITGGALVTIGGELSENTTEEVG